MNLYHLILRNVLSAVIFFSIHACYYDNEEDLYPGDQTCDTANVTYSAVIQPIIKTKCYVCHSAAANLANINLEGYNQLKKYVDNGLLIGSIKHQSGFSPMPKNAGKLPDCEISKIESWISAGTPP